MNYLIIESHPYEGSFNAAAANAIASKLSIAGHKVERLNLVTDGFDPVMRPEDLRKWSEGVFADPMVSKYQQAIDAADVLVFPFPVWWGAMPAVLKGFCDKVLLHGWAYRYGDSGELVGQLGPRKAVVISTMETSVDVFDSYFGNPVVGAFIKDTLETCGIEVQKHFQIDKIVSGGREYAEARLNEIADFFA